MDKIIEITKTVLANRGNENLKEIGLDSHLRNDLGMDSLDLAELTVRIEAEFDVDIFEDGIVNTIGEILQKLKQ
jgi:acyl carrier protein